MSIWQTRKWQEMLKKSNQLKSFFEIDWIFIEKRSLWLWEYWLFIIWLDILKLNWDTIDKIISLCKEEKSLFIQFEDINYFPNLDNNYKFSFLWILKNWYYKKFITPYTAVIDLEKSFDSILSEMKPKWRYNIRLAEKKWIKVLEVDKNDENIWLFYNLMIETTSRDWFNGNSFQYYKDFLLSIDESKLLLSYIDDEVISAWIFTYIWDIAIYYYWASTSDKKYRNLMAPYLLQWTAIKIWKELWCKIYDFLWVATPWDVNSSLSWVTDFKMKFTSDIRAVSKSYIYINKKIKYLFLNILRKIKGK